MDPVQKALLTSIIRYLVMTYRVFDALNEVYGLSIGLVHLKDQITAFLIKISVRFTEIYKLVDVLVSHVLQEFLFISIETNSWSVTNNSRTE